MARTKQVVLSFRSIFLVVVQAHSFCSIGTLKLTEVEEISLVLTEGQRQRARAWSIPSSTTRTGN